MPSFTAPTHDPAFSGHKAVREYRAELHAHGYTGPYQEPASWRSTDVSSALRASGARFALARGRMIGEYFGLGVPFVPSGEPIPAFLVPAFRLTLPVPLVCSETMLYRLRGATVPASFLDTGLVVETWLHGIKAEDAVREWADQLGQQLTVYPLPDIWLMHDPEGDNEKAFFVASTHFNRLY